METTSWRISRGCEGLTRLQRLHRLWCKSRIHHSDTEAQRWERGRQKMNHKQKSGLHADGKGFRVRLLRQGCCSKTQPLEAALQQRHQTGVPVAEDKKHQEGDGDQV